MQNRNFYTHAKCFLIGLFYAYRYTYCDYEFSIKPIKFIFSFFPSYHDVVAYFPLIALEKNNTSDAYKSYSSIFLLTFAYFQINLFSKIKLNHKFIILYLYSTRCLSVLWLNFILFFFPGFSLKLLNFTSFKPHIIWKKINDKGYDCTKYRKILLRNNYVL